MCLGCLSWWSPLKLISDREDQSSTSSSQTLSSTDPSWNTTFSALSSTLADQGSTHSSQPHTSKRSSMTSQTIQSEPTVLHPSSEASISSSISSSGKAILSNDLSRNSNIWKILISIMLPIFVIVTIIFYCRCRRRTRCTPIPVAEGSSECSPRRWKEELDKCGEISAELYDYGVKNGNGSGTEISEATTRDMGDELTTSDSDTKTDQSTMISPVSVPWKQIVPRSSTDSGSSGGSSIYVYDWSIRSESNFPSERSEE